MFYYHRNLETFIFKNHLSIFSRGRYKLTESSHLSKIYKNLRSQKSTIPLILISHNFSFKPALPFCRSYLILGVEKEGLASGLPGLAVGERTLMLEWRDDWHRRVRRLQRRAVNCH